MYQAGISLEREKKGRQSARAEGGSPDWERDVLGRFRRGEVEAFEEFVRHYQNRLYNFILRMSGNEDETRDILQDTFLKALHSLGGFRGESSIGTWLHGIAVNGFFNCRRKLSAKPERTLTLEEFSLSKREALSLRPPTPEEIFEEKEGKIVLEQAIARLPESYRAVLILRDLEGMPTEQSAEILHLSVSAVKSRLHRARLFVRRELEKLSSAEVKRAEIKFDSKKGTTKHQERMTLGSTISIEGGVR